MAWSDWSSKAVTPTLVVAVICSSLMAAIFTWYVNLPDQTIVTYVLTTTSTGSDATARALIPDLSVRIGDVEVPVIYTHVLELRGSGARAENVPFAITFPEPVKIYGSSYMPPSVLHRFVCEQVGQSVKCEMSPVADGQADPFKVLLATDKPGPLRTVTTASNMRLLSLQEYSNEQARRLTNYTVAAMLIMFASFICTIVVITRRENQRRREFLAQQEAIRQAWTKRSSDS